MSDLNINVMQWPALSPDLNPIENLWGDMARAVYGNGRQYHSVGKLKAWVKKAWSDISPARLEFPKLHERSLLGSSRAKGIEDTLLACIYMS